MKKIIYCLILLILASQGLANQDQEKNTAVGALIFDAHQITLSKDFMLNDFCIYDSIAFFYVFARLTNISSKYCTNVDLRFNYIKNGSEIASNQSYINLETYQSYGVLPYHCSLISTITEKADFDSISFQINYDVDNKIGKFLCDQILILQESNFDQYNWMGYAKNESAYSICDPGIFACFLKNDQMIYITQTGLVTQNDTLKGGDYGYIDAFVDIPKDYDYVKYYLSYSINSLDGTGNLPPNLPTFTEPNYKALVNEKLKVWLFILDLNDDKMSVMIDWGDGSITPWEVPLPSNITRQFDHTYSGEGRYYIKAKAKDFYDAESQWSDTIRVDINLVIPVELANFEAKFENEKVILNWVTISESNNFGFKIERKFENCEWQEIGFIPGHGSTTIENHYSFIDKNVYPGELYYRLKQIDNDGTFSYSEIQKLIVFNPYKYSLHQNYPNPFNSSTRITFELPELSNVCIEILNLKGEKVIELFRGKEQAGKHSMIWNASEFSTGTYFIRMQTDQSLQMKRCVLIK